MTHGPTKGLRILILVLTLAFSASALRAQRDAPSQFGSQNPRWPRTEKPQLHGKHWVAITGKPLGAAAGAMIFSQGGNAVDSACAMLAVVSTMVDTLSWGGETQALIYDPNSKKVHAINGLGVAPTGATPEFFRSRNMTYPPSEGPLAAVTPGTPGGLMTMLAEYGTMSLKQVLAPSLEMAKNGYPVEAQAANAWEGSKKTLAQWPYSRKTFLPHYDPGDEKKRWAPEAGEIWVQPDLAATLQKLIDAEQEALKKGRSRKEAILSANDRFYRGDIAQEFCRGSQEQGGLHTPADMAGWKCYIEEPVKTTYKGIEVYKLNCWQQGPVLLQALNILEGIDLKAMGYNSPKYMHTLYQVMNLAYADRDFYYGDPYVPPEEPMKGLLSKEYAAERRKLINWEKNDPGAKPGDPYPFQGGANPYKSLLEKRSNVGAMPHDMWSEAKLAEWHKEFTAGTTSIQAADEKGWVVSVTPSGGWNPACIAGSTGIGMSQRMQAFVLDPARNPFNVVRPGQRPRSTLSPSLALKDGRPFLSWSIQGGDEQDQRCLQHLLNVVEWNATVQQACEAPDITSSQMQSSFGTHEATPGDLRVDARTPQDIIQALAGMGYKTRTVQRNSGPMNSIFFDWKHGSFWAGSSNNGEDYGIAW
ncbi:MAG: Gamma-glutamyltransferase [Acidobacteria bacterium]|nr:Gamma-glutamyltransferase [Acidobacteriota bacterium]